MYKRQARFRIHTPLINLSKADIIRTGLALGLDYGLTRGASQWYLAIGQSL